MILLIDNYDSFTYNLYQQLEALGAKTKVFKNNKIKIDDIKRLNPSKIVISPGPGRPENAGFSIKIVQKYYSVIPTLGVCLGHQCIGQIFGSKIISAKNIIHGKTSKIYHNKNQLFKGISNPFSAARYHSLVIDKVPDNFILTAWDKNNEIMAIKHKKHPLFGIQFHPESFMTNKGEKIIHNFLYET